MATETTYNVEPLSRQEHDMLLEAVLDRQHLYEMRLKEAADAGDTLNAESAELHLRTVANLITKLAPC